MIEGDVYELSEDVSLNSIGEARPDAPLPYVAGAIPLIVRSGGRRARHASSTRIDATSFNTMNAAREQRVEAALTPPSRSRRLDHKSGSRCKGDSPDLWCSADVNCDGLFSTVDAKMILQYLAFRAKPSGPQWNLFAPNMERCSIDYNKPSSAAALDTDGNGKIEGKDAVYILELVVGQYFFSSWEGKSFGSPQCALTIDVRLEGISSNGNAAVAVASKPRVLLDLATTEEVVGLSGRNIGLKSLFEGASTTITTNKGFGHHGALVEADFIDASEFSSAYLFLLEIDSEVPECDIGVSLIQMKDGGSVDDYKFFRSSASLTGTQSGPLYPDPERTHAEYATGLKYSNDSSTPAIDLASSTYQPLDVVAYESQLCPDTTVPLPKFAGDTSPTTTTEGPPDKGTNKGDGPADGEAEAEGEGEGETNASTGIVNKEAMIIGIFLALIILILISVYCCCPGFCPCWRTKEDRKNFADGVSDLISTVVHNETARHLSMFSEERPAEYSEQLDGINSQLGTFTDDESIMMVKMVNGDDEGNRDDGYEVPQLNENYVSLNDEAPSRTASARSLKPGVSETSFNSFGMDDSLWHDDAHAGKSLVHVDNGAEDYDYPQDGVTAADGAEDGFNETTAYEVTLINNGTIKLGIKLMKNPDHPEGKGAAVREVDVGGQADGKIVEGQVISHINGTDCRDMKVKDIAPLIKATQNVTFRLLRDSEKVVYADMRGRTNSNVLYASIEHEDEESSNTHNASNQRTLTLDDSHVHHHAHSDSDSTAVLTLSPKRVIGDAMESGTDPHLMLHEEEAHAFETDMDAHFQIRIVTLSLVDGKSLGMKLHQNPMIGTIVSSVDPTGQAHGTGQIQGGDVISHINGIDIHDFSMQEIGDAVKNSGEEVKMTLEARHDVHETVTLTKSSRMTLGLRLKTDPDTGTGAAIAQIEEGGQADLASLQVDDVINKINGADVRAKTLAEIGEIVGESATVCLTLEIRHHHLMLGRSFIGNANVEHPVEENSMWHDDAHAGQSVSTGQEGEEEFDDMAHALSFMQQQKAEYVEQLSVGEVFEITLEREEGTSLGMRFGNAAGPTEGVPVLSVSAKSVAAGRMGKSQLVRTVNGESVLGNTLKAFSGKVDAAGSTVVFEYTGEAEPEPEPEPVPTVDPRDVMLVHSADVKLGMQLMKNPEGAGKGVAVKTVDPGGQCEATGRITANQVITSINGTDVTQMPMKEVLGLIKASPEELVCQFGGIVTIHEKRLKNDEAMKQLYTFFESADGSETGGVHARGVLNEEEFSALNIDVLLHILRITDSIDSSWLDGLSGSLKQQARQVFWALDKNRNGTISMSELLGLLDPKIKFTVYTPEQWEAGRDAAREKLELAETRRNSTIVHEANSGHSEPDRSHIGDIGSRHVAEVVAAPWAKGGN
jgi:C-terminal processing protease CtpA/Prc